MAPTIRLDWYQWASELRMPSSAFSSSGRSSHMRVADATMLSR